MLVPMPGQVLITLMVPSKVLEAEVQKKIQGFLMAKPTFEGVPHVGYIWALPEGYEHEHIKVGARIVFGELKGKGFKWEGETLHNLKLEEIQAVFIDD